MNEQNSSSQTAGSAYVLATLLGAFVGLILPKNTSYTHAHTGVVGAIIAFELDYLNLLTSIAGLWLVYWLFIHKVRGRQALVMYGGLGLVGARLITALLAK